MICIVTVSATNDLFTASNPITPTLYRGETPVHYFPPAQKLPPKGGPVVPYPGTSLFQFSPRNIPSQNFEPFSIHQYQPSVKPSSISSIYPDIYQGYKDDYSKQSPYNSAYQQNNYFHASPPYQPNYITSSQENLPNYQQYYVGFNDHSSIKYR